MCQVLCLGKRPSQERSFLSTRADHHLDPTELSHPRGAIYLGSLAHIAITLTFRDGKPRFSTHAPFPRQSQLPYIPKPGVALSFPSLCLALIPYCSTFHHSKPHTSDNGTHCYNSPGSGGEAFRQRYPARNQACRHC